MTVILFPHILANYVDIQKEHLLLHTPVLNKTPRYGLLVHCIYVSVTRPTCPAFSAWFNTGSIRSLKVTGKAIIAVVWYYHQSYVQHYMANLMLVQCVIELQAMQKFGLVSVGGNLSGVDSDRGTGSRKYYRVNLKSTFCPI